MLPTRVRKLRYCAATRGADARLHIRRASCSSRCETRGGDAPESYTFAYSIMFANDTALLRTMRPLLRTVLTVESFAASNGFTCGVEYNPPTCGATAAEPAGAWTEQSTCSRAAGAGATALAFTWTVPQGMDAELRYAVGHQHIGGRGVQLLATPPGGGGETLLCDSQPLYETAGPARGFVVSMSACDLRERPRRLAAGTKLRGALML